MTDLEEHWHKIAAQSAIWLESRFTVAHVCDVTGATPKAIEHFVNPKRGMVPLAGESVNPGTGRKRRFTGGQVLMIAAAYVMNRIGFPQRWSYQMAATVERRALNRAAGLLPAAPAPNMVIFTYPMANGDWAVTTIDEEDDEDPRLPVASQILQVDRLIDEVHAQLTAVVEGKEVPSFAVPDPEPQGNPFAPEVNWSKAWEKNEGGRWVYVGLSADETDELMDLQGVRLVGDKIAYFDREMDSRDEKQRFLELHNKHELARLALLAAGPVDEPAEELRQDELGADE